MKRTLSEIHPELVKEWSEKNQPLSPDQITYGSNKRVWWRGTCGHEWEAPVKARSQGENCPYCAGKRVLLGFNDLKTVAPNLAEEWSEKNKEMSLLSVTAGSHKKVWWKGRCGHEWQAVINNRVRGAGCPYCSGQQILAGFNDLKTVRPELTEEWSERNRGLTPSGVTAFSNQNVWWTCRTCGSEWKARIADRASGSRCPYCSSRRFQAGVNDLESTHPMLSIEWSERNDPVKATEVNPFSRQQAWWNCQICGNEWKAVIYRRVQGSPCPVCAGKRVRPGINDLATTDPALCKEWDEKRNNDLLPSMVLRTSRKTVWWKGNCGHTWRAAIADRAVHGEGCPQCRKEYQEMLPFLMILYYAWSQGLAVRMEDTEQIGLPLDFYFPQLQAAILFSAGDNRSRQEEEREQVIGYLCGRRQIYLIRMEREGESFEKLAHTVREAYRLLGIYVELNPEKDSEILRECYRRWKQRQSIFQ